MHLYPFVFCLLWLIQTVYCYKILVLCATAKSHIFYMGEAAKAFVDHGHDVTMVLGSTACIPSEINKTAVKFMYFHLDKPPLTESPDLVRSVIELSEVGYFSWQALSFIRNVSAAMMEENGMILKDKELFKRLEKERFDIAGLFVIMKIVEN